MAHTLDLNKAVSIQQNDLLASEVTRSARVSKIREGRVRHFPFGETEAHLQLTGKNTFQNPGRYSRISDTLFRCDYGILVMPENYHLIFRTCLVRCLGMKYMSGTYSKKFF